MVVHGNPFHRSGLVSGRRADQPSELGKVSDLGESSEGVNGGHPKIKRLI